MNTTTKHPKGSFKRQLFRTYLFVVVQFAVALAIVLTAILVTNRQTRYHLTHVGPFVETVNQLSRGVNESMLLLDKWFFKADSRIKEKRRALWEDRIHPLVEILDHQMDEAGYDVTTLANRLLELEIEQWIVEDLAHQQGNEYASDLYRRKIMNEEKQIFDVITRIINLHSGGFPPGHTADKTLEIISYAADIRGFFTYASSNLVQFILTGTPERENKFRKNLSTAKKNLALLAASHPFPDTQIDLTGSLQRLFTLYEYEANSAISIRKSPRWNQAVFNYNTILVPASDEVRKELDLLLQSKTDMLRDSSKSLIKFGYILTLIALALGGMAALFIFFRAHRDIEIAAELEETILRHNEELEELSRIDQLTELYNRRAMEELLNKEISRAKRSKRALSLAYFDIDDFKEINDSRGHLVGDEVLKHVGVSAQSVIREVDTPCRYGGDEFCIIFPSCRKEDARIVCEKMIDTFQAKFPDYSLSIGIAELDPEEDIEDEQLIKKADEKMYQAKQEKGSRIRI